MRNMYAIDSSSRKMKPQMHKKTQSRNMSRKDQMTAALRSHEMPPSPKIMKEIQTVSEDKELKIQLV